ncbi:hypothetical protein CHH91_14095 [Virgibacillus sp. 7505]|nr:hypothetical protein CHH91_14095 [Virgibacillus sp. 7505]
MIVSKSSQITKGGRVLCAERVELKGCTKLVMILLGFAVIILSFLYINLNPKKQQINTERILLDLENLSAVLGITKRKYYCKKRIALLRIATAVSII